MTGPASRTRAPEQPGLGLVDDARAEKAPGAFRTISEVADELDIPAHVLRFWESKFTQLNPMKRGGGRRYYRPVDVALLRGIRAMLYDEGLTIKGLQKVFRERGQRHVVAVGEGLEVAASVEDDDAPPPAPRAAENSAPARGASAAQIRAVIATLERARARLTPV